MQDLEDSPATTVSAADDTPQPVRPQGRPETPWAGYAIKGSLAILAVIATVGFVFALASGVWSSAVAAVVAMIALAAVARPTWRMLDAAYGGPVKDERRGSSTQAAGARVAADGAADRLAPPSGALNESTTTRGDSPQPARSRSTTPIA
jgi:hypothetical protein